MDFLFKSFQEPRAKRTFQTKSKKDCSFEIIDENPNEDHKSVMKKTRPRKFSFEELHATQVRDDSKIVSTDPNKNGAVNEDSKTGESNTGIMSSMLKFGTNLYFYLDGKTHTWNKNADTYLLGERYLSHQEANFKKELKRVLWFSYREDFPRLPSSDPKKYCYTSDRGWGCMLRVGQMMFAEVLKRNMFSIDGKFIKTMLDHSHYKICELFADINNAPTNAPFSIHNIAQEALNVLKKEPGIWYTSSNIIHMLSRLVERYDYNFPQMRVKIALFVEGTIFEDQILEKALASPKKMPKAFENEVSANQKPAPSEESKVESNGDAKKQLENKKWNYGIFAVVLCKTGLDNPNEDYMPTIKTLLKFKHSVGMLAGRGHRAYYVIGISGEDDLIYIDPHYVQKAVKKIGDIEDMMHTYTSQKCMTIKLKELNTSIGFGFYFDNYQEYEEFKRNFELAKEKDPNFLIGLEEETPPLPEYNSFDVIEIEDEIETNEQGFEVVD